MSGSDGSAVGQSALTVRWDLGVLPPERGRAVARELAAYVRDTSHERFQQLPGLRFKTWRMRPGEWFEGCYVFVDPAARRAFQDTFTAGAVEAPGSRIVGAAPVLIEECEVVAVAEGGEGFATAASYDASLGTPA